MKIYRKLFLLTGLFALFFASFSHALPNAEIDYNQSTIGSCYRSSGTPMTLSDCKDTMTWPDSGKLIVSIQSSNAIRFDWQRWKGYEIFLGRWYGPISYVCNDPDYPIVNGSKCDVAPFELTDELTASLQFKLDSSQSMLDEMIDKNNKLGDFIESTENAFDSALDLTTSSALTINSMSDQVNTANEFVELNPDSSLISSFADDMAANLFDAKELNDDNFQEIDSIVEIKNDSQLLFNDNNEIIGFTQNGIHSIYAAGEQILTSEPTEDEYNEQINIVDSNYDSVLDSFNQSNNNFNNVDTSTNSSGQNQPQQKLSNVNENNSSIQKEVNENNYIFSKISDASTDSVVCTGSKCDFVDDVDQEDEETTVNTPEHRSDLPYQNIDDAFTGFSDKISNSPVVTSMNNFTNVVSVPNAVCPTLSIDLSNTPIGVISTNIHCNVFETVKTPLSIVMHIVFLFAGFRIVGSA